VTTDGRRSVLVIRLSAIGDCVMTSAAVRALRAACPDDFIVWVVEPKSAGVVVGNPHVNEVLLWDRTSGGYFSPAAALGLWRTLKPYRFDIALDFHGLARSGMISALSGAEMRVVSVDSRECASLASNCVSQVRGPEEWVVARNVALLEAIGVHSSERRTCVPLTDESVAEADGALRSVGLADAPLLCLHLKGSWAHKFWPLDRFARVAEHALARWGLAAVVTGSRADRADAERLSRISAARVADLAGELSLGASSAVVARCSAVVSPDTCTVHMSAGLGVPTVALFGPTSPARVAPRGSHVRVVMYEMPCHPCVRRPTCVSYDCMLRLPADLVIGALDDLLAPRSASRPRGDAR